MQACNKCTCEDLLDQCTLWAYQGLGFININFDFVLLQNIKRRCLNKSFLHLRIVDTCPQNPNVPWKLIFNKWKFPVVTLLELKNSTRDTAGQLSGRTIWAWTAWRPVTSAATKCVRIQRTSALSGQLMGRAWNEGYPKVPEDFAITEKAPTRTCSWLKAPTSAFTFKTLS